MFSGRLALVLAAALTGCPDASPGSDEVPSSSAPVEDPRSARARAHREALARLAPLAVVALQAADPVASAQLGLQPLAPPPFRLRRRQALRDALDAADAEAKDIREELLEPTDAVLLRVVRFGLARARARFVDAMPWHTDPTAATFMLRDFASALEARLAEGPCEDCVRALEGVPDELEVVAAELRASSIASIAAARADLIELADGFDRLPRRAARSDPGLERAAAGAAASLRALDAVWAKVERALPQAASAQWGDRRIPPATAPERVVRLPDEIGDGELRRRLEIEEGVTSTLPDTARALAGALAQLSALARAPAVAPTERGRADSSRCAARWGAMAPRLAQQPALAGAKLDCDVAVRRIGDAALDDAELTVRLTELGVVEPLELARRREEPPALALVGGEIAPAAHRIALPLAVLSALGEIPARRLVLRRGIEQLCTTLAALRVHAEPKDPAVIDAALASCPADVDWSARARARPRAALVGLGLLPVARGPADAVALDRFPWAPMGLVTLLARPDAIVPAPPRQLDVEVEAIEPE
jgi:hypothetical protein